MMNFELLNKEVQEEVKDTLRVYDEVHVTFENGQYTVSTGMALKASYATDHKFIGTYYKKDIYTADEQIVIYIEEFLDYPIEYKGEQNWTMLKELKQRRKDGKIAKIKLVNGNAVIIEE